MSLDYDLIVIGAGPAGMAAASTAAGHGLKVLVLDEQTGPGGQIYRAVESPGIRAELLGQDYLGGRSLVQELRRSGVAVLQGASVWQADGEEVGFSHEGRAQLAGARRTLIASGALERPFPIPGWTLPGVMSAGSAQLLLKTSGMAAPDAIFAGSGPLLYLVVNQYRKAGVPVRAVLDTTPPENYRAALRHLPGALGAVGYLMKGLKLMWELQTGPVPWIREISGLRALGRERLAAVEYREQGVWRRLETENLFLHQGVVPNVNLAMAAGCDHVWDGGQLCFRPVLDEVGRSSVAGVFIAGDGAGIGGAVSAGLRGRLAALGVARDLDALSEPEFRRRVKLLRGALARDLRVRPFLETLYRPAEQFRVPGDDSTLVCRCEEVSAATVRETVQLGCEGPNQLKSFCRAGMGPCQGRLCGLTITETIARARGVSPAEVGYYRLRPPVKPLLLGELAGLEVEPAGMASET